MAFFSRTSHDDDDEESGDDWGSKGMPGPRDSALALPITPLSPRTPITPKVEAALSKGFLDDLRGALDEQAGNDLELDDSCFLWVDGAKTLNDPEAFANSCFLYDGVSEMDFDISLLGDDRGKVVAGNMIRLTCIRVKPSSETPRVALLGFAVVTSSSTPPSALHTALQGDFPLQAEFDSFGERVEGLALELARGLVLAKEETAETTKRALAERDAQIAERDARIAELINSMNGDMSRRESTTDDMAQALIKARTSLASQSYDSDEARLRVRTASQALEASEAAFAALTAECDRLTWGKSTSPSLNKY